MLLNSPYLEAVQAIPGMTPGEKYKELNAVAQKIATGTKAHGDASIQIVVPDDVPQALVPRIRTEICNYLKQYEGVIEALKSDDVEIVDCALRFNWFFRDGNENIINVDYFETNLFSCISLNTRLKLIKRLATSLRASGKTALAEKFYTRLAKKYGKVQAEPFLIACSETFIWDTVIENKIVLSCRLVKNLFLRYPDLIIRYLKLSKVDDRSLTRNVHRINIHKYSDFLPRLIKNHLRSLIELIEMHNNCLGIHLSNKATERFLKSNVEVVLNNPILYGTMMPLKVIAAKITKAQFKTMFAKVYPPNVSDCRWYSIEKYIGYYPEQERISLLLDTYKEVYNANMLDNPRMIDEHILVMLPPEERARQARIKLETEPDWRDTRRYTQRMWRCYLPVEESIPSIKTEISKSSSPDDRSLLLQQMFYTCRINDDKDSLLQVLSYFTTRHKNERPDIIFEVLESFVEYIDLFTLGNNHWTIINGFMRFLHIKEELTSRTETSKKILAASIYFSMTHDLPTDEFIAMVMEINFHSWRPSWCILEKYPQYDRICLDTMVNSLPTLYPDDHIVWKSNTRLSVLQQIVESIYDFNTRNAKVNQIEKLSINNYPWVRDGVKALLDSTPAEKRWELGAIIECLKNHEPELYDKWIYNDPNILANVKTIEGLKVLKENPDRIRRRWEDYLKALKTCVTFKTEAQRFIKSCRWHQDIPINFATQCLKEVNEKTDGNSLVILGILMEGSSFVRVIEPYVPKEATIDVDSDNAKLTYKVIYAIPRAINLTNPPIPLSLMVNFCAGEYLSLGLMSLTNICRRISVDKVEKFARELTDNRVSVKKHGIRLFGLVSPNDEFLTFLKDLWKTEKHRSIRAVVFEKIYDAFVNDPSPETWEFFKNCLSELAVDDDDILDKLMLLNLIPNDYIAEFIERLFEVLENLRANGFNASRITQYVGRILTNIDGSISSLLPEEYSEKLLRKYFCNPSHLDVSDSGVRYAIDSYLRGVKDRLEARLVVFGKLYVEILKKHWDVPDPKLPSYFPINQTTHAFVNDTLFYYPRDSIHIRIMETILQSFLAVLKPEQDWITYTLLSLGVALKDAKTQTEITEKISEGILRLVETTQSSSALVVKIAVSVKKWIDASVIPVSRLSLTCDVLEALCRIGTLDTCIVAASLLFRSNTREFDERHNKVIEFLKQTGHPTVVSLVYEHINSCTSTSC